MSSGEDVASSKIAELFKEYQLQHRASFPSSCIDFDDLNVTEKVTRATFPMGQGHYSDVYKGEMFNHTPIPLNVAVKILRLPMYDANQERLYESVIRRFFRELSCWSDLRHLNIARMLGFTLEQGSIGLVSLWYPNGNLVEYLKSNPKASKPNLALDVAEGIRYLHTLPQPLVHGDMKGVNIFVSENGIGCLGDFGISTQIHDLNRKTGFTTTSGVRGTIPWMAPELLNEEGAITFASDVYAFGCLLIEVWCSGKSPYHYMNQVADVIMAKYHSQLPDRHHYPELSEHEFLWDLMCTTWTSIPEDRPSIQILVERLYWGFKLRPRIIEVVACRPLAKTIAPDLALPEKAEDETLQSASFSLDEKSEPLLTKEEMDSFGIAQVAAAVTDEELLPPPYYPSPYPQQQGAHPKSEKVSMRPPLPPRPSSILSSGSTSSRETGGAPDGFYHSPSDSTPSQPPRAASTRHLPPLPTQEPSVPFWNRWRSDPSGLRGGSSLRSPDLPWQHKPHLPSSPSSQYSNLPDHTSQEVQVPQSSHEGVSFPAPLVQSPEAERRTFTTLLSANITGESRESESQSSSTFIPHPTVASLATSWESVSSSTDQVVKIAWSRQVLDLLAHVEATKDGDEISASVLVLLANTAVRNVVGVCQCGQVASPDAQRGPLAEALYLRGTLKLTGRFPAYFAQDHDDALKDFEQSALYGYRPSLEKLRNQYSSAQDNTPERRPQSVPPPLPPRSPSSFRNPRIKTCRVLFPHRTVGGELALATNDIVEVLEENQSGWWLVRRKNRQGWAPSSHLELVRPQAPLLPPPRRTIR